MAGAMHKMAVYLGLVEEDRRYDDGSTGRRALHLAELLSGRRQ